jgi:DNA-binding CsgD family transcriptional regulator
MTVSDWFAIALLLILSALTLGIFLHIAIAIRQLRHAQEPKQKPSRPQTPLASTQFHSSTLLAPHETLTKRETQVARLAARGMTDVEIAAQLSISERTVGNHLYSIYRKLNINSRRELKYILQEMDNA